MASARKEGHSAHRLILASGAVIALARGDRRAFTFLTLSLSAGRRRSRSGKLSEVLDTAASPPLLSILL